MIIRNPNIKEIKDVEFLYIEHPSLAKHYLLDTKESDVQRNQLPRRIITVGDISLDFKSLPICKLGAKISNSDDATTKILNIYDHWIDNLLCKQKRNKLSLSLYFQDNYKLDIWDKWWSSVKNKPQWIKEIKYPEGRPAGNTIEENLGDINIWRHIPLAEVLRNECKPIYYEQTSYHNPFFSFLYSISPDETGFLANYVLRQVAEAGLMRILIIDDRIARVLWNKAKNGNIAKTKELSYMGLWVANKISIGDDSIKLIPEDSDSTHNGLVDMKWKKNGEEEFNMEIKCPEGINQASNFDILFIHKTIFDDKLSEPILKNLFGSNHEGWKEEWSFHTKRHIPYIIFHSGRGVQKETLPKNVGFLEYSILQQYVLQEPSKFFLTMLAMSVKEATS